MTGGVAKNVGIRERVEKALDLDIVLVEPDPMIAGALGAALFARDLLLKSRQAA